MRRRITHELQIIGRILVVTSHIKRYHLLKKLFRHWVEREKGIAVDIEELALGWVWTSLSS
jgi:hypothetical protein